MTTPPHLTAPFTHTIGYIWDAEHHMVANAVQDNGEDFMEIVADKLNGLSGHLAGGPFYYKEMAIYRADHQGVLMVRGWGRLQYLPDGDKAQDAIGDWIALRMNDNN